MGKLSIGQHGIQVETHEKTNVMSPFHTMGFIVFPLCVLLILISPEMWVKILGAIGFILFLGVWVVVYVSHSIKRPDLLQSEHYRIEKHKIESGMIENRKETLSNNILTTNTSLLIEKSKEADTND